MAMPVTKTGNKAEAVKGVEKHRAQQWIYIAERREGVHVRMHEAVEQDMRVRARGMHRAPLRARSVLSG